MNNFYALQFMNVSVLKYPTMSIISLENIAKSYFGNELFSGLSLSVDAGDRIAVIGENGTGKTTLLRLILGHDSVDSGRIVKASSAIVGYLAQHTDEMADLEESALENSKLRTIEIKLRELETLMATASDSTSDSGENSERSVLTKLMDEYSKVTAQFEAVGGYTYRARLAAALAGLGLSGEILDRPVSSLSGGERMRACMARLLINEPDLLLLDEPTNHLDIDGIEWLEKFLNSYGGALIFVSHDRSFINNTANKVCEIRNGKLHQYKGNYESYLVQKKQEEDFARQQVQRLESELARQEDIVQTMLSHRNISGYHAREKVVGKLSEQLSKARKETAVSDKRMNFHFVPEERSSDPDRIILKSTNLTKEFSEKPLFVDVNLELRAKQKLFVAGPNGCGKSTLINCLTGKDNSFTGNVKISETVTFAQMGQFVHFADEQRTILDELMAHSDLSETAARTLLARFGFRDIEVFKQIQVLSGGERSRLYLCFILEERPDLLFLDEPTNHLDINSCEILEQALADYSGAILAISHDRYFIDRCADTIAGFVGSEVRFFDAFEHYRQEERKYSAAEKEASASERSGEISSKQANTKKQNENRAELRRTAAKRKKQIAETEELILEMEAEKDQLETEIGPDTPPETYVRIAELDVLIEEAFNQLIQLAEEE